MYKRFGIRCSTVPGYLGISQNVSDPVINGKTVNISNQGPSKRVRISIFKYVIIYICINEYTVRFLCSNMVFKYVF